MTAVLVQGSVRNALYPLSYDDLSQNVDNDGYALDKTPFLACIWRVPISVIERL